MLIIKIMILKILDKLRYLICLSILLVIGLITSPLTLFFKWKGLWLLFIMNAEKCSLLKARYFLLNDPKYKIVQTNDICCNNFCNMDRELERMRDEVTSPAYSFLPHNLYYQMDEID